jgi:protein TonB
VDVVKFVKPVVAKAEEVTEEPPKIVELKEKKDWCRNN